MVQGSARVDQIVMTLVLSLGGVAWRLMQEVPPQDAANGITSLIAAIFGTLLSAGVVAYFARKWVDTYFRRQEDAAEERRQDRQDDRKREDQRHTDNREAMAAMRADHVAAEDRIRSHFREEIAYLRELLKAERERAGACELVLRDERMKREPGK